MPTPYQIDFFDALKDFFDLTVVYFTLREKDRLWQLPAASENYKVIVLNNSAISKLVQKKITSFHFSWEIINVLRRSDAELVIVNGIYWTPNVVLALFLSKRKRKKVSYWNEPLFPSKNKLISFVKYIMLAPVRQYTDFLLAIGKNAKVSFRENGYKKEIYNIPYSIDTDFFDKKNLDTEKLRNLKSKFCPDHEIIILTSGTLTTRKGVDTLIQAFLGIPETIKAKFIIVGEGPDRSMLEELSKAAGDRICFVGFIEKVDIPYYFGIADIFAFASRYDGWGLVINEAIAANLAIICSDGVGAAADKLINNVNSIVCPVNDIVAFRNAMLSLINNPDLRNLLVENIKKLTIEVSSKYNAEKIYGLCDYYK